MQGKACGLCLTVDDRELELTAKFLKADERNFHCWGYRQVRSHRSACTHSHHSLVGQHRPPSGPPLGRLPMVATLALSARSAAPSQAIVALMGVPPENELAFVESKINHNFSNYSAWCAVPNSAAPRCCASASCESCGMAMDFIVVCTRHYKSSLIPRVHTEPEHLATALKAEAEIAKQVGAALTQPTQEHTHARARTQHTQHVP